MIEDVERFKNVTSKIEYHNEKIIEAFNLYVRLFSAIVGGAVWLSTQADPASKHGLYGWLANILVGMLTTTTTVTVIANWLAWYEFRKAEAGLVGENRVRPPSMPRSCLNEIVMVLVILTASGLFCLYNPLRL
jgi:hypothetical protein